MKLKACIIAICTIVFISANAQFRGGVQLNALKLPASAGNYGMSFGPGIDVAWSPDEAKYEAFFNAGYYLPAKSVSKESGFGSTQPTVTDKTSFIALGLGGRYYFLDRQESDFNVYATASVNLLLGNTKTSYAGFPQGYQPDDALSTTHQFMISAGAGASYKVAETGSAFLEAQYRLPTGTYNSRTGYVGDLEIPGHPWFSVGYRFTIGGGSSY